MGDEWTDERAATEEFDAALVGGLMRGVWTSAAGAVALSGLATCCGLPFLGALPGRVIAIGLAATAILAALVSVVRLASMPPEFRALVSPGRRWLAVGIAALGAGFALLQIVASLLWLAFAGSPG